MRGKTPDYFDDMMEVMNWLELGYSMYGHDPEVEHIAEPRVIKSHLPLKACPPDMKKIYVYRDINDAVYSMFPFMTSFVGLVGQITVEAFCEVMYNRDKIDEQLGDLCDWWEARHNEEVLFLFYDELLSEHRCSVQRIAEFMELEPAADDALIDLVTEQTTHSAMAATRGPRGHDPFNEDVLAPMFFKVRSLFWRHTHRNQLQPLSPTSQSPWDVLASLVS